MNGRTQWILSALAVPVALAAGYGLTRAGEAPPQPSAAEVDVAEYPSMTALRKVEPQAGWELSWKITESPLIVVAPHGGSIELRTSEIATAVAAGTHTECHFKGKLPTGNYPRLHVTSTNWDVEECLILIRQRPHALSIHGTAKPGRIVYVGGRDTVKGAALTAALRARGFQAEPAPDDIAGLSTANFVNKDADGAGVQLELTYDLRLALFPTATGAGPELDGFVAAVRSVYP
ncbi:poly-gamma-glutamate hydrolase family protein [Micromonospora sp. BQ11]|uniref:poly-gamma-glutamate hydrolase family protein n=1 Tax=Micromonospora sp. BQ11 TaxID=3452212 RepID=UPI003F8BDB84